MKEFSMLKKIAKLYRDRYTEVSIHEAVFKAAETLLFYEHAEHLVKDDFYKKERGL